MLLMEPPLFLRRKGSDSAKPHGWSCVLCIGLLLCSVKTGLSQEMPTQPYIPGELLVRFKPGVPEEQIRRWHSSLGVIQREQFGLTRVRRLQLPIGLPVDTAVALYRNNPDVDYAEPDYVRRAFAFPLDPDIGLQWALHNTNQFLVGTFPPLGGRDTPLTIDADIDAPEAWDITTGSDQVIVAVIDSGVDYAHPDLSANIWTNPDEDPWSDPGELDPTTGNGTDDDLNGYTDDRKGWNFVGTQQATIDAQGNCNFTPEDPIGNNNPMDDFGHGTPVAGVIAAAGNNREGISGVMWSAKIMPLKVLDAVGCGIVGNEIAAIEYAIQKRAQIIVLSSGAFGFSHSELDVLKAASDAGVLVVAAAGNSASNNDNSPVYPASYGLPNIISVAASDFNDRLAVFSNSGHTSVDLAAPGDCVYSTMPSGTFTKHTETNFLCTDSIFTQNYDYNAGTSFAAAHVAGVAGLLLAQDPAFTPAELKAVILSTVDPKSSLDFKVASGGRLNAYRALTRDTGSTLSNGTGRDAGCLGYLHQKGGPGSPGTAAATVLSMTFPLLLASRRLRTLLRFR
jgi:subtilisin family serine protease